MMVAGFRGTLYRSYEFPPLPPSLPILPLARYECAMCEQQDLAIVGGEYPGGGFHPLLVPRDPGQTNDGQFTSNRKNFLKLGLKWAKGEERKEREREVLASLGVLRIIPGHERVLFYSWNRRGGEKGEKGPWPWPCTPLLLYLPAVRGWGGASLFLLLRGKLLLILSSFVRIAIKRATIIDNNLITRIDPSLYCFAKAVA